MFIGAIGVIIYGSYALLLTQKALPKTYILGPIGVLLAIGDIVCLAIPLLFFFI
jgi:hypothetical protein